MPRLRPRAVSVLLVALVWVPGCSKGNNRNHGVAERPPLSATVTTDATMATVAADATVALDATVDVLAETFVANNQLITRTGKVLATIPRQLYLSVASADRSIDHRVRGHQATARVRRLDRAPALDASVLEAGRR